MRSLVLRWAVVIALTAVGLAASAALLVDYTKASPVFCAEGGGCDALRQTAYARPFGVPLPVLGVLGFVVLATLAFSRGARVRRVNLVVAAVAGVAGVVLLSLQAVLHHLCPYCAAVDASATLLGVLAWDRWRLGWDPPAARWTQVITAFGLSAAVAAPLLWGRFHEAPVPDVIREELARTPKGEATVVDFVDFECPFCRLAQARLAPLILARKDKVRIVRKLVPLTRIHHHALDAAKAVCCADVLGKGEAMADALFAAKVDDLTPEGCAHIAESLGLPLDRYRACLDDPATQARLASDRRAFDGAAAKGDGLPLMWIGTRKLMGAQPDESFSRALGDAIARAGS